MVFAFAGVFAGVNALADAILLSLQALGIFDSIWTLAGISAVIWFALFAVLRIALEPGTDALRGGDAYVLAVIVALALFPASWAAAIAVFGAGAWLYTTAIETRTKRVALVLLGLSGPLLWGKLILIVLGPLLLALDGHLVGFFAGTSARGNTVEFAGGVGRFLIGGPCSSVHNISLAILLWSSAIALLGLRVDRRLLLVCLGAVAAMFALNIARLTAMALLPAHFDFLHTGTGATVLSWVGLGVAGLIIGGGAYGAIDRQR